MSYNRPSGKIHSLGGSSMQPNSQIASALKKGLYEAAKEAGREVFRTGINKVTGMDVDQATAAGNVLTTKYNPAATMRIKSKKRPKKDEAFETKVKEVMSDKIGTQQLLKQLPEFDMTWQEWNVSGVAAQQGQACNSFTLFGSNGSAPYHNELANLFLNFTTVAERESARLMLKSGVVDVVFWNDQVEDGMENRTPGALTADIDIYECICVRNVPNSLATNPQDLVALGMVNVEQAFTPSIQTRSTSLGATPFQSPTFCQYFKIVGKSKIYLSAGDSSHVEFKAKFNNKKIDYKETQLHSCLAGITRAYIVCANNVRRLGVDTANLKALTLFTTKRIVYESDIGTTVPQGNTYNS